MFFDLVYKTELIVYKILINNKDVIPAAVSANCKTR